MADPAGGDWAARMLARAAETARPRRPRAGPQQRMYAAARASRLTGDWYAPNNSADAELWSSLTLMRARSRTLMRDSAYAKRVRKLVVDNVVGTGIGLQAQVKNTRGRLLDGVNSAIEEQFCEWSRPENCHTGGALHFADLERQAMGQVVDAGEIFVRQYFRRFGNSAVPLALELVEPERLADDYQAPAGLLVGELRMGVEQDEFGRALGYWIRRRHPSEWRTGQVQPDLLMRIPADEMFHLRIINRWPQSRGEPWLHAVMRRLNDMDGYSEAEIVAARASACYMGFIETPEGDNPNLGTVDAAEGEDGQVEFELESGAVRRLQPGEEFNLAAPNRPNPNMEPFMRLMLREFASGADVSYEGVSRDYSRSNYSSSRLSLIDDRDGWRALQRWFVRSFRVELHRAWLHQAVLARAIPAIDVIDYANNRAKFEAASFKCRGWSWVDPTKEVAAYASAVRNGFTTLGDVIALTGNGKDLEDLITERRAELELLREAGLIFDTDPSVPATGTPAAADPNAADPEPADPADPADDADNNATAASSGRVVPLRSNA